MGFKKQKDKRILQTILRRFSKSMVLILLLFILIDFIIGGIVLWKYGLKAKEKEITAPVPLVINQGLLHKFSTMFVQRQAIIKSLNKKQYIDCFIGPKTENLIEE